MLVRVSFYKPPFGANRSHRLEQGDTCTFPTHSIKTISFHLVNHSIKSKLLHKLDVKSMVMILVDAFPKPQGVPCWIRVTNLFRKFWTLSALEHAFYKWRFPAGFPPGFSHRQQGMLSLHVNHGVFMYNHGILMNFDEFRTMRHNDV